MPGGLLYKVEEIHRESEAILCLAAEIGGRDFSLCLIDKWHEIST